MTTAVAATEPAQVDYWQLQSSKFSTPFDRDKHLMESWKQVSMPTVSS